MVLLVSWKIGRISRFSYSFCTRWNVSFVHFIIKFSRLQLSFIYPYQFQYNIKSIMGGNYKAKQEFRRNQALWLFSGLWGRVEIFTLFCRVLSLPWFMKCAIKCREVDGYSEHIAGGSRAPPTTVNQPALIRYAFLVRRVKTQHL